MTQRHLTVTIFSALFAVASGSWVQHAKADNEFVLDAVLCSASADPGGSADCVGPQGTILRWDVTSDGCYYSQHWVGFDGCQELEGGSAAFLACNWERDNAGGTGSGAIVWAYDYTSPDVCSHEDEGMPITQARLVCGCATPQTT